MTNIFLEYILPLFVGCLTAWSFWYLFIYPGTSDFWTSFAILDLGGTGIAIVFIVGAVWFDL